MNTVSQSTDSEPKGNGSAPIEPAHEGVTPERAFLNAESVSFANETELLRDSAHTAQLGIKAGRRLARKAFADRVDAIRR